MSVVEKPFSTIEKPLSGVEKPFSMTEKPLSGREKPFSTREGFPNGQKAVSVAQKGVSRRPKPASLPEKTFPPPPKPCPVLEKPFPTCEKGWIMQLTEVGHQSRFSSAPTLVSCHPSGFFIVCRLRIIFSTTVPSLFNFHFPRSQANYSRRHPHSCSQNTCQKTDDEDEDEEEKSDSGFQPGLGSRPTSKEAASCIS